MILNICAWQNSEYAFTIKDITPTKSYDDAGIDRTSFTSVILTMRRVNDTVNELTLDITDNLSYLYDCTGLKINFSDFGEDTFNDYDYWPDELYSFNVTYQYDGTEYSTSYSRGFHALISRVVTQHTLRADWKKELSCDSGCSKHNSVLRRWHFLQMMKMAAELCLINEWRELLVSLYKLTGTTYEFS